MEAIKKLLNESGIPMNAWGITPNYEGVGEYVEHDHTARLVADLTPELQARTAIPEDVAAHLIEIIKHSPHWFLAAYMGPVWKNADEAQQALAFAKVNKNTPLELAVTALSVNLYEVILGFENGALILWERVAFTDGDLKFIVKYDTPELFIENAHADLQSYARKEMNETVLLVPLISNECEFAPVADSYEAYDFQRLAKDCAYRLIEFAEGRDDLKLMTPAENIQFLSSDMAKKYVDTFYEWPLQVELEIKGKPHQFEVVSDSFGELVFDDGVSSIYFEKGVEFPELIENLKSGRAFRQIE